MSQKQWHQERRAVHADANDESEKRTKSKIAVEVGAKIDNRLALSQRAPEKQAPAHGRDSHGGADRVVVEPVRSRSLLKRILEAAEKGVGADPIGLVRFVLLALILNYFGQGALVLMLRKRSTARFTGCSRSGRSTQW